ncbi:hypothetical protein GCM10023331_41280 [Algivirga pacifica]|uniref:Tox-PL domain-containing protein n=1 Tax=Algivirga pacifica TaxID=1162670 RepID=A0ABP9DU44_9BACT
MIAFIDLDGLEEALPWYLRDQGKNKKPLLTFGLHNVEVPTVSRRAYLDGGALNPANWIVFTGNSTFSIYNGAAEFYNLAMEGVTGTEILMNQSEQVQDFLNKAGPEEYKDLLSNPILYENLVATLLTRKVSQYLKNPTRNNKSLAGSIKDVNVGKYKSGLPGAGKNNCTNCVIAVDTHLQGRKASAMPYALDIDGTYTPRPVDVKVLENHFSSKFTSTNQKKLMSLGEGKRGVIFGIHKKSNLGHVFNIANQNGKINIIDGQTGGTQNLSDWKSLHFLPTN